MKKKKIIFYVLCFAFSLLVSGCSQVTELSVDDENRIADYCAKTVAKFNSMKPQGIVNVSKKGDLADEEELTELNASYEADAMEQAVEGEAAGIDGNADGMSDFDASGTDASDASYDNAPAMSLTEAMGVAGLSFSFDNAREVSYYAMGGYYDISPATGNDFLVLTFHVTNSTDQDVVLDIPSSMAKFRASVGGVANTADNTILLNDLSNYSGTISPGASEEMVLLFQFPPANLTDFSSIHLQMIQGDTTTNISL